MTINAQYSLVFKCQLVTLKWLVQAIWTLACFTIQTLNFLFVSDLYQGLVEIISYKIALWV